MLQQAVAITVFISLSAPGLAAYALVVMAILKNWDNYKNFSVYHLFLSMATADIGKALEICIFKQWKPRSRGQQVY